MAGTIIVDTITDGSGNTTSATSAIRGSAKAWVNYNGTVQSIRASYNVSSVTRNAAGDYTVNFTTGMTDTNYVTVIGYADTNTGTVAGKVFTSGGYNGTLLTYTTASVRLGGTTTDMTYLGVAIFR